MIVVLFRNTAVYFEVYLRTSTLSTKSKYAPICCILLKFVIYELKEEADAKKIPRHFGELMCLCHEKHAERNLPD